MPGDEEVIEGDPGKCRKCGMELVPIRLDSVWTCATRPLLVVESKPGKCPVDGTPLIQVTAAVSWSCKDKPSVVATAPGTCADGSPMVKQYAARAHGNHNPQHGGVFFMAPDAWHHLEGTYLRTGVFRLHLYDDFTKPLPLNQVREVSASLFVKDAKTGKEAAIPLVRSGRSFRRRSASRRLPGADVREGEVQGGRAGEPVRLRVRRFLERASEDPDGHDDQQRGGHDDGPLRRRPPPARRARRSSKWPPASIRRS
jgi:hypothetical protein